MLNMLNKQTDDRLNKNVKQTMTAIDTYAINYSADFVIPFLHIDDPNLLNKK